MILWNSELTKRLVCTEQEKAALPFLIKDLVGISSRVRAVGVKALIEDSEIEKNALLRYGFRLISEGLPTETIEEILAVYLAVDGESGFDFLKRCIYAEALVSISAGDSADITLRKLAPYCGADRALPLLTAMEAEQKAKSAL